MSSSQRKRVQASTQKQPWEEEPNTISLLSDHKSRESNHQIDTPEAKRKKLREDEELWSYALLKPPPGKPDQGNSNQKIFYCKRCFSDVTGLVGYKFELCNQPIAHLKLRTGSRTSSTGSNQMIFDIL